MIKAAANDNDLLGTWKQQLTASISLETLMNIDFSIYGTAHLLGETATRPNEPRYAAMTALLLVAGVERCCLVTAAHHSPFGHVQLPFLG